MSAERSGLLDSFSGPPEGLQGGIIVPAFTECMLSSLGKWLRVEAPLDAGGALTVCLSGHPLTALAWLLPYLALRPGAVSFFSQFHCIGALASHFVLFVVVL
ncbi:MAG: hypothetical protein ACK56F_30800, partial [bacterium]